MALVRVVYDPLPPSGTRPGVYAGLRVQGPEVCGLSARAARLRRAARADRRGGWRCVPVPVLKHGPNTACGGKTRKRA